MATKSKDATEREQRIEEIARQIEDGTYTIDLDLLAECIIKVEILPPDQTN